MACGRISQSSKKPDEVYGIKNMALVVAKRLKIQGFIVSDPDFGPKYAAEHQRNLQKWLAEGSFKAKSSVTYGIDNGIKGFLGMLKGENFGKAVLEIAPVNVSYMLCSGYRIWLISLVIVRLATQLNC